MKKKTRAMIVALCLAMISSQCVYADPIDSSVSSASNSQSVSETSEESPEGSSEEITESLSNSESDEQDVPDEQEENNITDSSIDVQEDEKNDINSLSEQPMIAASNELDLGNAVQGDVVSAQLDANEMNCTITLSKHTAVSGEKLSVAVWSDKDGQDDLKWYSMSETSDGYTVSVPIKDHKTEGLYYAHVYSNNGFINSQTFTVSGVSYDSITVENVNNDNGTCDVVIKGLTSKSGIESVTVPTWSQGDQSDLKWYAAKKLSNGDYGFTLNISNHKYNIGKYNIHVYATTGNDIFTFAGGTDVTFTSGKPVFTIDKADNIKVKATNVSYPAGIKSVSFAVWSDVNEQDDLKWFDGTYSKSSKTATLSYKAAEFNSYGKYYVHMYGKNAAGTSVFLGGTTYDIEKPSCTVSADMDEKGYFDISISDAKCVNGVKSISVAVWSKSDQSDLVWYSTKKNASGNYTVSSNISKHKYNVGTYQVHAYLKDNNGVSSFAGSGTMTYKFSDAVVSVTENEKGYTFKTSDIALPGNINKVTYAVWSDVNGQDDLKWYSSSCSNGVSSFDISADKLGYYGKYYVHAYAGNESGGSTFVGSTTFEISKPQYDSADAVVTSVKDGTFTITIKGLAKNSGISSVVVPTWSKSDQSDIVWYSAEKSGDDYVVKSDVSKHKYNAGTYNAHVYIHHTNGMFACLEETQFKINVSSDGVSVDDGTNERYYNATLSNLVVPGGVKSVSFAVWSDKNGQDDLKWYRASKSGGNNYTAKIDIKNHKTEGKYYVHAYYTNNGGGSACCGTSEFEVTSSASVSMSFADGDKGDGSFEVTIKISKSTSTVESLSVPVWCASDQSDLVWYSAKNQGNGVFTVQVDSAKHGYRLGSYKVHSYATFSNGISSFAGGSTYNFSQDNYIKVVKPSDGKRTITLQYPSSSATKVSFAVWSDANGQDDLIWYTASKQGNTWVATMNTANHKDAGTYLIHCYVNGKFASNTTCSVAKSEMKKNGWFYENGYKFYYINDVKQTDVRNVIGAQSTYRIQVNRTCNTVTIYAKDGNNGYIIPVCAFACSVGLPGTPTYTGTYTLGAKYRWKELMGPSYGQYSCAVNGQSGVYFHSVAGSNMTSYNLSAVEYNKLGSAASHGCIRLCVRDAKWIYDNVPSGSQIYIYDSSDPGPMGKPATIKIPAGQTWDPTDPAV